MEHTTPTKDEIQLLIKNGLLENNEKINKTMEAMAEKISKSVGDTTATFLTELLKVATEQATTRSEVAALKTKLNYLWAKMIAVGAACMTIGGFIGLLISTITNK